MLAAMSPTTLPVLLRRLTTALLLCLLAACAAQPFVPGKSTRDEVLRAWGVPAMRWAEPDGGERLAYPMGPMGYDTYMVTLGPEGKVRRVANVLVEEEFAQVRAGESKEDILRRFGPPFWVETYPQRHELVWEWRYCDVWTYPARFDVLFDTSTGLVRSTLTQREGLGWRRDFCSR